MMEGPDHRLSKDRTLPGDRTEVQKLQYLATRYILIGELLYKKSYSKFPCDLYLRCLKPEEAMIVLPEINDGDYGNHAGG